MLQCDCASFVFQQELKTRSMSEPPSTLSDGDAEMTKVNRLSSHFSVPSSVNWMQLFLLLTLSMFFFFFVVGQQNEDYSKRRLSAPVYDIPRLFRKVHFSHVAQFHIFRIFTLLTYCDFALELGRGKWCPSPQQHGLNVSVETDRSVHFPYSSAACWNLWPRLQLNTEFVSRRYEPMMKLSTEQLEAWVLFTEWHVTEKNPSNRTGGS